MIHNLLILNIWLVRKIETRFISTRLFKIAIKLLDCRQIVVFFCHFLCILYFSCVYLSLVKTKIKFLLSLFVNMICHFFFLCMDTLLDLTSINIVFFCYCCINSMSIILYMLYLLICDNCFWMTLWLWYAFMNIMWY